MPKYTGQQLEDALKALSEEGISLSEASKRYGVPRSTLQYKMHGKHSGSVGAPVELPPVIEERLVKMINFFLQWRLPLTADELKNVVKEILDESNFKSSKFPDNRPGRKWLDGFKKRHNLTFRMCDNLKSGRCLVGEMTVNEYFKYLETALKDIHAHSIFNYDETNLTEDPKKTKINYMLRHRKRLLFQEACGEWREEWNTVKAVLGDFLPPMVVYKGVVMKQEWKLGGPRGTHYGITESGWFDRTCFEDWFFSVFLPYVRENNIPTPIAMIGDNLALHFSEKVIGRCMEEDIRFLVLPSNSTHIAQPLDVGVFRGMKARWREQLLEFRKVTPTGSIPRSQFPKMLNELCENTPAETIVSSFRATGIFPLNRNQVLKRIPSKENIDEAKVVEAFGQAVCSRMDAATAAMEPKRMRRDGVTPGNPVTLRHLKRVSYETDKIWYCCECSKKWVSREKLDWIVCDICFKVYHFHCTNIKLKTGETIGSITFKCIDCKEKRVEK